MPDSALNIVKGSALSARQKDWLNRLARINGQLLVSCIVNQSTNAQDLAQLQASASRLAAMLDKFARATSRPSTITAVRQDGAAAALPNIRFRKTASAKPDRLTLPRSTKAVSAGRPVAVK